VHRRNRVTVTRLRHNGVDQGSRASVHEKRPRDRRARLTLDDVSEEREAAVAAAVEELTDLVVDHLLPVAHRHRTALAGRLGLGLPELLALDLLRRIGPLPSGTVGERVGLTRSTATKMLQRLEAQGHVVREPDPGHRQGHVVRLLPHEERDRVLEAFRRQVRDTVRSAVGTFGLYRDAELARAAGLLIHLVHGLQLAVNGEFNRVWWARARVRRRRAREAAGMR
jgi:predicted transcriptional regulator